MSTREFLLALLVGLCALACEEGSAGLPDAGYMRGTCTSSVECGGRACLRVPDEPDGWRECAFADLAEVTECAPEITGCCSNADCSMGAGPGCFEGPLWYCGGAFPVPSNECLYDACESAGDCADGDFAICLPRGAFAESRARCLYGTCRSDADCSARDSGQCRPFFHPCHRRVLGFHCTYADSTCRASEDCTEEGTYCSPGVDGATECAEFIPPP